MALISILRIRKYTKQHHHKVRYYTKKKMGAVISRGNVDFEVVCKTGDVKGAGTDSNVYLILVDEKGDKSRNILLDCNWRNDFEQGNVDTFPIRNIPNLGKVKTINLWRDSSGVNDDWFVESIKIKQHTVGKPPQEQTGSNSSTDAAENKGELFATYIKPHLHNTRRFLTPAIKYLSNTR